MIIGANGGTLPPETQNLEPDAVVQEASFGNTNSGSDTSVDSTSLLEKVRAAAISLHRESLHEFQDRFLGKSKLSPEKAYWFFLRRAAVPCGKEGNRFGYTSGGGDFLWNRGSGTIIDPGRDFLDHLQRIGGSLADVRNIVITNDNDSHLGQFETIRKLLLHGNLAKNVRFFLNLGAIQKLSGVIDLNDKSFSEGYLTLHSGAKYPLLGGGEIKAIPAYHQELKSVDQAVGVVLNLTGPAQENKTILYTSATGLFPLTFSYDSTENRIVHISDKHQIERIISRRYKDEIGTGVDLMVVHLGSTNVQFEKPSDAQASQTAIKTNEFQHADLAQRPKLEELPELCCSGRLGYLGVREVIAECKPKLAVVNEWDRETMPLRADLCKLLKAQCDEILTGEPELPTIVPGDLTLVYDIFADAIYDCVRCDWMPAKDIDFALEKPCPCSPEEVFYFPSEQRDTFESMPKFFVDRYLNALKFQQELHFYRL